MMTSGIFRTRCTALGFGQLPIIGYCMSPPAKRRGVASPHWHGRSWLWWSNLTYVPVSYTTWHDPLISRSTGPNLPSVPRLRFRGAPAVSHCTLRGPPSWGAEEQKVTFQLSVSLSLNSSSSQVQVRLILRKLGSKWDIALPDLTTKRGGESLVVCLLCLKYGEGAGEITSASESQIGSIWLWTFHCVFLCACTHSLCTFACTHWQCVQGEMRMGRNDVQK